MFTHPLALAAISIQPPAAPLELLVVPLLEPLLELVVPAAAG